MDIVERLIVLRDVYRNTLSRDNLELLASAANEITQLKRREAELLRQVQTINPLAR